jgi:hypothetical protein
VEATLPVTGAVFGVGDPIALNDTLPRRHENALAALGRSPSLRDLPFLENKKVIVDSKRPEKLVRSVVQATSFEQQIFNTLVSLKVAVSQYAMHLSNEERHRIFAELDSIINTEDWHEGDQFPKLTAFQDFLKWMIYSKYNKWISFGVSDDGNFLVAWKTRRILLTAKFSGLTGEEAVRWTVQINSENGDTGYTVGKCPLRLFSKQALFYLNEAIQNEPN